jgi:FixJ family two-component response regulator
MPTIMISGCADISTAVKAMSAGALDFLEKPVNLQVLAARIREALDCYARQQRQISHKTELSRQMEKLSARQREVLHLLMAGERCKQIARELGIGEKTVAKHRATVLEKMQVDNVVELVHLFANTDLTPALAHAPTLSHASLATCQ